MNSEKYSFVLLTPTLCHGAEGEAELREPSIRGHLRFWHTILWGKDDTDLCWGNAGKKSSAGKVVLRLSRPEKENVGRVSCLPHAEKEPKGKVTVPALLPSRGNYVLNVSFRYLKDDAEGIVSRVRKTLRCWLLMGTVGQRSTRAFGSVWPLDDPPASPGALESELGALLAGKGYAFRLSIPFSGQPDMKICTDTLSGKEHEKYFGYVNGSQRKTSPLKMKFVRLNGVHHLLLHARESATIDGALRVLREKGKPVGERFPEGRE